MSWIRTLPAAAGLVATALLLGSCGYNTTKCRLDPEACLGYPGGFCEDERDCRAGTCCTSNNCGGGMCTYTCDEDVDCPPTMRCKHDTCFYACESDLDCASGMSCEHDNTICEWD